MATGPVDVLEPPEADETGEEFSRKKKSKFQTFKNFFAKKKKRKEPSSPVGEYKLKPSQSSSDVSTPNLDPTRLHLPAEPGSKGSMGNKALSHDSVFIFESSPDVGGKSSSQENLPGKVKALQLQLQQNLPVGSPPLVIAGKKAEDAGAVSEDDGLPRSPPEIATLHDVLTCSTSKVPSEASSRPISPLFSTVLVSPASPSCRLLPIDFNSPATPLGCLDTSAAKHRIAINPRKQKAFASKTQHLAQVEHLEMSPCQLVGAGGKISHAELLEDTGSPEQGLEGFSILNASDSHEKGTCKVLPVTRNPNPLRYSWNAGPGMDGTRLSALETSLLTETDFPASVTASCPSTRSPFAKRDAEMEEEGVKITGRFQLSLESPGAEVAETPASLQSETKAAGVSPPASCSNGVEKHLDAPAGCIHVPCSEPVDQKAKCSGGGSEATHVDRTEDGPSAGNSCVALETDPALRVPWMSLSPLEAPSEAEQTGAENSPAEAEPQPLEDRVRPTSVTQEGAAILDADVDVLLLQGTAGEKPFPATECHSSVSDSSLTRREADVPGKVSSPSARGLAASGPAEVVSRSSPPDDDASEDQSGSANVREGSKVSDEKVKTPLKSTPAKPVRFTIAPAWQRSLSGGSSSVDGSCPRNSPSSPIRPELFEGIPQLDTAVQGSLRNSLEKLDKDGKNSSSGTSSSTERPSEESPFGIKLRRTSSLLKYQTDSPHHEPSKQVPSAPPSGTSPVSVNYEPKPSQNLVGSAKSTKPTLQEERNASKVKPEEAAAKQPMGKPSEQIPAACLEAPSAEPVWISVAKLKQKGFQGHPLAKGQKEEENPLAKTRQEGEKRAGVSQQEKQVNPTAEDLLKKTSTPQLGTLENKVQLKMTASATTVVPVRTVTQEVTRVEKEVRQSPNLPISSCGPAEPPWLSLAKKKAKAWSEMPQIVQ